MNARCKKIMLVATVAMFGLAGVTPARAERKSRATAAERPLAPASPPESVGRSEPAFDLDAVVDKMLGHHHDHEGKANSRPT